MAKMYLQRLGVGQVAYMFFPANFWPHMNHRMLLTAYGIFLSQHPEKDIDLVLTGAFTDSETKLKNDARKMGIEKRVHFLGLLPQNKLAAVWHGCSFLIFPPIYKTSFVPLLEAMSFNKPVLCSGIPLFSEVARDAALYFDPQKPVSITRRLEQILSDVTLRFDLVQRGQERIMDLELNEPRKKLRDKIRFLSNNQLSHENSISGIYEDKWTEPEIIVSFKAGVRKRWIEFHFDAPSYLPNRTLNFYLKTTGRSIQRHSLKRGDDIVIRQKLPKGPGYLTVWISPVFRPSEMMGGSTDRRILGCLCHGCWLVSPQQERITLFRNAGTLDRNNWMALLA